jgi:hypothetical protein
MPPMKKSIELENSESLDRAGILEKVLQQDYKSAWAGLG